MQTNPPTSRLTFGLNYTDTTTGNILPLPLQSIDVDVRIIESIAKVEYSQIYHNNTSKTLHVDYIFPISTGSCFESLFVKYKSFSMEGEIQKKKDAKEKYQKAIKEGKTAVYAEMSEESNDLMLVKIGNMEPDTSMTISLCYIEQLDTSANKLWKYTALRSLKPRNSSSPTDHISILNYPYLSSTKAGSYQWRIQLQIEAKSKINFVQCPNYQIHTEYDDMIKAVVTLDSSQQFTPTTDFVLYYSTQDINKPQALLTQYEDGYCALVNFMPQTNHKGLDDAYKAELENSGVPDIEFERVKGEFIFLLDRSGSMSGGLVRMAREALVIFLKSIPADSYFNIISFGSSYEMYSQSGSLLASQENIDQATQEVLRYEGDMGGTEILTALSAAYKLKAKPETKKKIFLLTDGEVSNNKAIYKSIQEHADIARVFSIGIGSSASRELIIQSAHHGKGCYEFVDDSQKIGERVISLLTLSMQICAYSFQLAFPMGLDPRMVVPHPETVEPVYEGKYLTFFIYFDKQFAKRPSVKLNLVYRRDEQIEGSQQPMELAVSDCLTDAHPLSQSIWKLGMHKMFGLFKDEGAKDTESLVLFGGKPLVRDDIEALSIKYGILSHKTAFVCVSKDENNQVFSTSHSKVFVSNGLSRTSRKKYLRGNSNSDSSASSIDCFELAEEESEDSVNNYRMMKNSMPLNERSKCRKAALDRSRSKSRERDRKPVSRGGRGGREMSLFKSKDRSRDNRDRRPDIKREQTRERSKEKEELFYKSKEKVNYRFAEQSSPDNQISAMMCDSFDSTLR